MKIEIILGTNIENLTKYCIELLDRHWLLLTTFYVMDYAFNYNAAWWAPKVV